MTKEIVIADDEEYILDLMSIILKAAGFRVRTTTRSHEVLSLCRDGTPDLLILDVMMPEISGPEIEAHLKSCGLRIPVLYVSGYTADKVDGPETQVLPKPFAPTDLVNAVRILLDGNGAQG